MTSRSALPSPGRVLRDAVTAAGYRPALARSGVVEDLDAVAGPKVRGSTAALFARLERRVRTLVENDAGELWGAEFGDLWEAAARTMRTLAAHVDLTCIAAQDRHAAIDNAVTVPVLAELARRLLDRGPAPKPTATQWLDAPIEAWLALASEKLGITTGQLTGRLAAELDVSDSTMRRWRAGEPAASLLARDGSEDEPTDVLPPGHRRTVLGIAGAFGLNSANVDTIDMLTGWLAVSVAFQSLPRSVRTLMTAHLDAVPGGHWTLDATIEVLGRQGFERNDPRASERQSQLDRIMRDSIRDGLASPKMLRSMLERWQAEPYRTGPHEIASASLFQERMAIRIAILESNDDRAMQGFKKTIEPSWWCAGWQQVPLLEDALLFAAGTGRLSMLSRCLSRLRLLAPEQYPWSVDDNQTRRMLGAAFETRFPSRKTKGYIPMPLGSAGRGGHYRLSKRNRKAPNALQGTGRGRTRYTPLMEAVDRGTVSDVDALLDAGGNPDVHIPESGDTAVTRALRRAATDSEGRVIVYRLFEHGVSPETLNRASTTVREMPIDLGIDLDDPKIVLLLIEHGAATNPIDPEAPLPLCRVLVRLHMTLARHASNPWTDWIMGAGASITDAWHGAISRGDFARVRQGFLSELSDSPEKAAIATAVHDAMRPDPAGCRAVLRTLLEAQADPNRRDSTLGELGCRWTPLLLAATIGDLEAFELLLGHGGDPESRLRPVTDGRRIDALHIAVLNGHTRLVDRLRP